MPSFVFTSYSQINWDDFLDRFVHDLSHEVLQLLSGVKPQDILFVDQERINVGERWGEALAIEISGCKVCIAVCSPAFVASEFCGKEVAVFLHRLSSWERERPGTRSATRPMFPVVWIAVSLPEAFKDYQLDEGAFGDVYRDKGLRQMYQLKKYEEARKEIVLTMAERIKDAIEKVDLPSGDATAVNFTHVPSAFRQPDVPVANGVAIVPMMRHGMGGSPFGDGRTWGALVSRVCGSVPWRVLDSGDLGIRTRRAIEGREIPIVLADIETLTDAIQQPKLAAVDQELQWPAAVIVAGSNVTRLSPSAEQNAELTVKSVFGRALAQSVIVNWRSADTWGTLEQLLAGTILSLRRKPLQLVVPATATDEALSRNAAAAGVPIDGLHRVSAPGDT